MSVVLNDLLLFSCLTALVTGIVIALIARSKSKDLMIDSGTWAQQTRRELETSWLGANETVSLAASPTSPSPKDFRACREPDTRSACSKFGRGGSHLA
jgi:Flp pilus assembly protein protease CpaA